MDEMFELEYNAETGKWKEYGKPYKTVDFPTEEDWETLLEAVRLYNRMKWHPASKPPEIDKDHESDFILLNVSNFYIPIVGFYAEDRKGDGVYYSYDSDVPLIEDDLIVTAWMPLPEPYQPVE